MVSNLRMKKTSTGYANDPLRLSTIVRKYIHPSLANCRERNKYWCDGSDVGNAGGTLSVLQPMSKEFCDAVDHPQSSKYNYVLGMYFGKDDYFGQVSKNCQNDSKNKSKIK